ncbi:arginine--tRNA ligase, partial [Streptomyces sp. SL13]|nr:arginine--tRNA ligase [Streptantibioticus silvisoli]
MTPAELARAVVGAVRRAVEAGELDVPVPDVAAVKVTRARGAGRGEYATGIALRLAGPAGLPARTVAERVARHLTATP